MVTRDDLASSLLLGTGGPQPGLWAVGPTGEHVSHIVGMPPGSSVYAVDMAPGDRTVAIGTRAGTVELMVWPENGGAESPMDRETFIQGPPVLSVCTPCATRFLSSDTAGRCFLWSSGGDMRKPRLLDSGGECVCSLLRLPGNQVGGLTSAGTLLFWDANTGQLLNAIRSMSPPRRLPMVRLRYWPALDTVLYAATGGALVLCHRADLTLRAFSAHEGDCYVVLPDGDLLHTVGQQDRMLKTWRHPGEEPARRVSVPGEFLSGEVLPAQAERVLLIARSGEAAIYDTRSTPLQLVRRLPGNHYRIVAGPSSELRETAREQQRQARARVLCTVLQQRASGEGGEEDAEDLHRQLIDLGFTATSLLLRARRGAQRQDVLAELKARVQLARVIPPSDPRSRAPCRRLIQLLAMVWQPAEALTFQATTVPAEGADDLPGWLTKVVEVLENDAWIAEPGVPMDLLIRAATLMGKPFTGRWVLSTASPLAFPEGGLTAAMLAAKYEQVRKERNQEGLPAARAGTFWWLSQNHLRPAGTVLFEDAAAPRSTEPRLAVRLTTDGVGTVVVPSVILWIEKPRDGSAPPGHNAEVLRVQGLVERGELCVPRLREVAQALNAVLRRLRTLARHRSLN